MTLWKINFKCCVIVHQNFAFGLGWKKHSLFFYFQSYWPSRMKPRNNRITSSLLCCLCHKFSVRLSAFFSPSNDINKSLSFVKRVRAKPSLSQDHSQLSNMTLFLNASRLICHSWEKALNEIWGAKALIWLSNAYIFLRERFFFCYFDVCTTEKRS